MAASIVSICNLALMRLGQTLTIQSLEDNSKAGRACKALYELTRNYVLEDLKPAFARRRDVLAELDDERTNWTFTFDLPADFLCALRIEQTATRTPRQDQKIPFSLELNDDGDGLLLCCDVEEPELVYIAKVETVGLFTPGFIDALAWRLASELVMPMALKPELAVRGLQQYELAKRNAIANLMRGEQEDAPPESEFTSVRG